MGLGYYDIGNGLALRQALSVVAAYRISGMANGIKK
jgi:hypothetical protein